MILSNSLISISEKALSQTQGLRPPVIGYGNRGGKPQAKDISNRATDYQSVALKITEKKST
jgi:hypothetical protein